MAENIFGRIFRDIAEAKEGRIRRVPAHWKLAPDETRDDGSYEIPGAVGDRMLDRYVRVSTDKHGRKMNLISKRAVHCPNPEYTREYASLSDDRVRLSIPDSVCRKCKYYRSASSSRRRYATCGFKASENPAKEAAQEFDALLTKAVNAANEIMGG